jgi:small subunit ribosomal protein S9
VIALNIALNFVLRILCCLESPVEKLHEPGQLLKMKAAWLPANLAQSVRITYSARPRIPNSISRCLAKSQKSFSTTPRPSAIEADDIKAAAEIRFPQDSSNTANHGDGFTARLVPVSASYFTGNPSFTDNLLKLQTLLRKYETLPALKPSEAPRVPWKSLVQYRNLVGEQVKASKYQKIVLVLQRLNLIHPSMMPTEVMEAMADYKRDIDPQVNAAKPIPIDKFGRALGSGRRKASVARAWVVEGNGEVLVNGKSLAEAFGRIHDRESAIWPLKATNRIDKYNVWALVEGGGTTGQAEAMTLAVAKALMAHEPLLKPALRRGKLFRFHYWFLIITGC